MTVVVGRSYPYLTLLPDSSVVAGAFALVGFVAGYCKKDIVASVTVLSIL